MSKKHFKIFILSLGIAGILMSPFLGCSNYEDLKISAFFSPNDHNAYRIEKTAPQIYIHLPYAMRYCTQCHLPSGFSNPQKTFPEEPAFDFVAKAMPNPWRLLLPVDQLCMKCHRYDTSEKTFSGKVWIHAPSAQGACIFCHSAHESQDPHLLRSKSSTLCVKRCHLEGYIMKVKAHQGSRECIECHNPHVGINSLMLKKDYREMWLKPRQTWLYTGSFQGH